MQNTRALLVSLLVAMVAVFFVYAYISNKEKALMELATPIKVAVAVTDIPEGVRLDENMVEIVDIPKKYVQPGTIGDAARIIDRTVTVPVLQGTQILESMFAAAEAEGIAAKIPASKRAFSISVNEVTAVAELVQPGDMIDIMVTVEVGSYKEGQAISEEIITKTVLENILVLAVNRQSTRREQPHSSGGGQGAPGSMFSGAPRAIASQRNALRTLTLALSPEETQIVNLAQEIGTLSVALRSRWDKGSMVDLPILSAQDYLGIEKSILPRSQPAWVEIRGAEQITRMGMD